MAQSELTVGNTIAAIIFIGALYWWSLRRQKDREKHLKQLAERRGLKFETVKTGFRMFSHNNQSQVTGQLDGRKVAIRTYFTGAGRYTTAWHVMSVSPKTPSHLAFLIEREDLETQLSRGFGSKRIMTGDKKFDPLWSIQTNQTEFMLAALGPDFRARFCQLCDGGKTAGKFELAGSDVSYTEDDKFVGGVMGTERVEPIFELVRDLAAVAEVFAQLPPKL